MPQGTLLVLRTAGRERGRRGRAASAIADATSALADRINIMRFNNKSSGSTGKGSVMISVQNLLDCGWADGDTGGCWRWSNADPHHQGA